MGSFVCEVAEALATFWFAMWEPIFPACIDRPMRSLPSGRKIHRMSRIWRLGFIVTISKTKRSHSELSNFKSLARVMSNSALLSTP